MRVHSLNPSSRAALVAALVAGGAAAVPAGASAALVTPVPASKFTDSVGVNMHLSATNTPYYSQQASAQAALAQARIRHVRAFFLTPKSTVNLKTNPNQDLSGDRDTNSVALLGRAGVRSVIVPGPTVQKLYANNGGRYERPAPDGWASNFTDRNARLIATQKWLIDNTNFNLRITGLEGVNEPNLIRQNEACTNWPWKVADYQQRLIDALASDPNMRHYKADGTVNVEQISPPPAVKSPSQCPDSFSNDPFRGLGRNVTLAAAGTNWTYPWNAGWVQPANFTNPAAWFTAGSTGVARQIDTGNLHAYPNRNAPQEILKPTYWQRKSDSHNACGDPAFPGDDALGTWVSCSANIARTTASGALKPTYMTEAGYTTTRSGSNVAELARGVYTPRLLLENFAAGIKRTYLYELMNGTNEGFQLVPDAGPSAAGDAYKALDRLDWAIGNGDLPGDTANGGDFADPLDLTITELSPPAGGTVKSKLFQEKDGSWSLALWPTDPVVDTSTGAAKAAPTRTVRLDFPVNHGLIEFPIDPASTVNKQYGNWLTLQTTSQQIQLKNGYPTIIHII